MIFFFFFTTQKHHMFLLVEFSILSNLDRRTDSSVCLLLPPPIMETKRFKYMFYPLLIQCRKKGRKCQARNSAKYPWFPRLWSLGADRTGGNVWKSDAFPVAEELWKPDQSQEWPGCGSCCLPPWHPPFLPFSQTWLSCLSFILSASTDFTVHLIVARDSG